MQYLSAKNPSYNADGTITLTVNFAGLGEVPFCASDTDNESHGREIYARAQAGDFGAIAPYVAPPPAIPAVVSIFQACAVLESAGLLDQVEAYFTSTNASKAEKIAWQRIQEVRRDSPLLARLAALLQLSDEQLDSMFISAAQITV